jgi:membrane fusion protein, multidrug efflux system
MRLFIVTLLAASSILLSACSQKAEVAKRPKSDHLVERVMAERKLVVIERERTGTLQAIQDIQIYNQEEGRITYLPFYEGDKVKEGDIVARLDDRLLQSQLARTQALRRKAEQDLRRIRGLANKQMTSPAELTRVETDLAVAIAEEQSLKTKLDYATLRAPISGIVSQRFSEAGNIAERYTHLLTISDQSQLMIEVTVSELLINKLRLGDKANVRIDALADNSPEGVTGTIYRIHPNVDRLTRSGIVEIAVNPVPNGARPGQLARVTLRTQEAERLLIPFVALRRAPEGEYVFVIDDQQRAQKALVRSGLRVGDQIEILSGIVNGQQVIIRGFTNLHENKKVTPALTGANAMKKVESAPSPSVNNQ